jgi:hypothetical protein
MIAGASPATDSAAAAPLSVSRRRFRVHSRCDTRKLATAIIVELNHALIGLVSNDRRT